MCERLLIVWRWTCSTHAGSGLCGCGGGVVECHRHPCVPFGGERELRLCSVLISLLPFGVDQAVLYYWHGLPVVSGNFLENGPL